jgi:transcriptional regulator with XRE-family HTH domain
MNIKAIYSKLKNSPLLAKLVDRKYRNLFIASQVNKGIPYQLRALRAARGMTQAELAERAGTKQTVISRIENKGAGNLSVKTLLKLAEAFDVALVVRFERIDRFIAWLDRFSPEDISFEASGVILKSILGGDVLDARLTEPIRSESAIPGLKLAKSPPTAADVNRRTTPIKSPPLFDPPLGVVPETTFINDASPSTTSPGILQIS